MTTGWPLDAFEIILAEFAEQRFNEYKPLPLPLQEYALSSIAISLKRIADSIE